MTSRGMPRRAERGQSTVEFAIMTPLIVFVALAIAQVALVAYSQIAVVHTAREVARAVSREPAADVAQVQDDVGSLPASDLQIDVSFAQASGSDLSVVRVHARYEVPSLIGFFGMLGTYEVEAAASMLVEP